MRFNNPAKTRKQDENEISLYLVGEDEDEAAIRKKKDEGDVE